MATSERRVLANRENAKRSTGPRTAAGRARSRMNALRHGLSASIALLNDENEADLQALAAGVYADLRPRGQAEAVLVDQFVSAAWKLRRLGDAEDAAGEAFGQSVRQSWFNRRRVAQMLGRTDAAAEEDDEQSPPPLPSGAAQLSSELSAGNGPLLRLMALEHRLRGTLTATLRQLQQLRALSRERDAEDVAGEGPAPAPAFEVPPGRGWEIDWGFRPTDDAPAAQNEPNANAAADGSPAPEDAGAVPADVAAADDRPPESPGGEARPDDGQATQPRRAVAQVPQPAEERGTRHAPVLQNEPIPAAPEDGSGGQMSQLTAAVEEARPAGGMEDDRRTRPLDATIPAVDPRGD